ncbi:MAG: thioesterase [Chlorobi bacterium]|nr:thioesterase [Chlorobiota bacterium]
MKIKIEFPEKAIFETQLPVGIWHINYGNHMDNSAPLQLAHEARIRWLKSLGLSESNIGDGTGTVMVDSAINYLAEAFHGDELKVQIVIEIESSVSFRIYYRMIRLSDNKPIAIVTTRMVGFDYERRRPKPLPEEFIKKVNQTI